MCSSLRLRLICVVGWLLAWSAGGAAAGQRPWLEVLPLTGPCAGNCAVAAYGGRYVENSMSQVLISDPEPPLTWDYAGDDHFAGAALSRRVLRLWGRVDVEPEAGIGRRLGRQDQTEVWGAFFLRYRGFPWDEHLLTSFAISTGLNYASEISQVEQLRARDGEGSRVMHYFAPELTFALPSAPNRELMLRFHHRSGVFGVISDAWGGSQYATVGIRWRF